jgi:uncharacterized protein YyaL (SSP411 family)
MKHFLTLLFVLPFLLGATEPQEGSPTKITWVDFNTGMAQAEAEGKIAIIDCYTEWCGWCKVMDKSTFSNDTVIRQVSADFIAIKFNPELDLKYDVGTQDSVTGQQLLMALSNNSPSGYPTFFFLVPQNKKMFQVPGYQDVSKFTATLDNLLSYQKSLTVKAP